MKPTDLHPELRQLAYRPDNFADLYLKVGGPIWDFIRQWDNVIRMETATFLERAAVEPLAEGLLKYFGAEVNEDRTRQMIGHMVRQIMEKLGYEIDRSSLRFTRENMFTGGTSYRKTSSARDRSMRITREQREAWAEKTAQSPFNNWLNPQIRNPDGTLNLEKMYRVAKEHGVTDEYPLLNPGQQRMNIGVKLRAALAKKGMTFNEKEA